MTEVNRNPITCTISFEGDGKRHGHLCLPDSRDDSAWGTIMIPVTIITNGDGPTALLTGGNHGDEYEGPIALQALAHELDHKDIRGRVIVVPYMNYPAFRAGKRTSPRDRGNLNRAFPGRPDGTPTEKIAHYFTGALVPLADAVLDMHSGGRSLDFLPFAAAHRLDNQEQQSACIAAMEAFNAPYSMILREIDAAGMYDTSVEAAGKVFVTTELGGGGSSTARSARIAQRGVRNFLKHIGVLPGEPDFAPSVRLDTTDPTSVHVARCEGLIEFLVDLGEPLSIGQPLARIWSLVQSGEAPTIVGSNADGVWWPGISPVWSNWGIASRLSRGAADIRPVYVRVILVSYCSPLFKTASNLTSADLEGG